MVNNTLISTLETRLARVEETLGLEPLDVVEPPPSRVDLRSPERPRAIDRPRPVPRRVPPVVTEPVAAPAAEPAPDRDSLEDLLGGRVLAWVGGAAVLVGLAFFLAIAVSRGWLGPEARCLLAAGGGLALLACGLRARPSAAALTAIGAGIAALDVDVAVAARVYDLLPVPLALAAILFVGVAATALAVRRDSETIAAFGIVGGLLAPVLAGATYDGATVALLLVAAAPAAALLVARRWDRIAAAAFAVTAPQMLLFLHDRPSPTVAVLALAAFGALSVAQAVGFELRTAAPALRPVSAFLVTFDALLLAGGGVAVLPAAPWLGALAAAHLVVGVAARRSPRVSRELGLLTLGLGAVLADVALGAALSGAALPVAYAAGAIVFAALSRTRTARAADRVLAQAGVGGHVLLAAAHALVFDAAAGGSTGAAALALGAIAAASFTAARVGTLPRMLRGALDVTALVALAWLSARTLDPLPLALAWSAAAVALAQVWRRTGDAVAAGATWAHAAGALVVALIVAPPTALADGLADPLAAALALGALVIAMVRIGRVRVPLPAGDALGLPAGVTVTLPGIQVGAALALYLASTLVVTPLSPHAGQAALTALWSLTGAGAVVAGLMTRRVPIRRAGLALLVVSIGKAFLVDLATLDSAARAGSFLAVGVLLLGAAAAWHRYAPRPDAEPARHTVV